MRQNKLALAVAAFVSSVAMNASAYTSYRTLTNCHSGPGVGVAEAVNNTVRPFTEINKMVLTTGSNGGNGSQIEITTNNADVAHPIADLVGLQTNKVVLQGSYIASDEQNVKWENGERSFNSRIELKTKIPAALASSLRDRGVTPNDEYQVSFYMNDNYPGEVELISFKRAIVKNGGKNPATDIMSLEETRDYRDYVKCYVTGHAADYSK